MLARFVASPRHGRSLVFQGAEDLTSETDRSLSSSYGSRVVGGDEWTNLAVPEDRFFSANILHHGTSFTSDSLSLRAGAHNEALE
jgi:hypothetical protein